MPAPPPRQTTSAAAEHATDTAPPTWPLGSHRPGWWLLAVLLHAVVALLLHNQLRHARHAAPAQPAPGPAVTWLWGPTPSVPAPPTQPDQTAAPAAAPTLRQPRPTPLPTPRARAAAAPTNVQTQAITLPEAGPPVAPGGPAPGPSQPAHAPLTPPAAPPDTPARLNLALPARPASAPPAASARQDPRSNPPVRNASERFADTLGTDQTLRVQTLNDGGKRWHSGSRCIETRPARESQLNPFDPSARALPQQAKGC